MKVQTLWGLFDEDPMASGTGNEQILPLTRNCIAATALKSRRDLHGSRSHFRAVADDAFRDIHRGISVDGTGGTKPTDKRAATRLMTRIRDFNVETDRLEKIKTYEDASNLEELRDETYANDWLDEFGEDAWILAINLSSTDLTGSDFRALLGLGPLSGEDAVNALLFSLFRDPRIPKKLLKSALGHIPDDSADGALNLLYALGLNEAVKTSDFLTSIEFDPDVAPNDYEYFGTPFFFGDLYWLAAARPGTGIPTARRICRAISLDPNWKSIIDYRSPWQD